MPSRNGAPTIRALVARRRQRPCKVANCTRPRDPTRYGGLCQPHYLRQARYGHHEGRRIARPEYVKERQAVARLFAMYPHHEGVRGASAWAQAWLDASASGDKQQPGYLEAARLHRYGVTGRDIVADTCAMFAHFRRRALPDDERLTWALAYSAMYLAPREVRRAYRDSKGRQQQRFVRISTHDRRDIGTHLRLNLARLYVNVHLAIDEHERRARDAKASFGAPFTP